MTGDEKDGGIELGGLGDDARFAPPAGMRHNGIRKLLATHVGDLIGILAAAKERQAHDVVEGGEAVLGLGENCDAEAVFGQVGPLMEGDFESGEVVHGIVMGRPLDITELHFVGGVHGADVYGESNLEEFVRFLPVDVALEFHAFGAGVKAHDLRHL